MKKSVIDLTAEELDKFARDAWRAAAQEALAKGLPVTGSDRGRRVRYQPDGKIDEMIANTEDTTKPTQKSVA
jgi:hypothetical protein